MKIRQRKVILVVEKKTKKKKLKENCIISNRNWRFIIKKLLGIT